MFRTRKNKNYISRVSRKCTCSITPLACGKCALDYQVSFARERREDRVFWSVGNIGIRIFQKIAAEHRMPYPTWHGFRRGRTSDLVAGKYRGENISYEDIFESGGWLSGSRAILHYLKQEVTDVGNVVRAVCCLSDTDLKPIINHHGETSNVSVPPSPLRSEMGSSPRGFLGLVSGIPPVLC